MEKKGLLLLFQNPLEPVFTPKDNGKAILDMPDSFYTERFKDVATDIVSRFGDDDADRIPLRDIAKPDLTFANKLGKRQQFSLFNDLHKQIAGRLIDLFLKAPDVSTFLSLAAYSRDRLNPVLFQYAFSVAVQHRADTQDLDVPTIVDLFPNLFVDPTTIPEGRLERKVIEDVGSRRRIEIPQNYTASEREEEQRLAYFREDIGVNIHHWHWHLVYPQEGPPEVVNKDRRGELFFYMHHQIMARYNAERFASHLARVKPLSNLREPIIEAYFPKIISSLNNRTYPPRTKNTILNDIQREDNEVEVTDLERWRDRIHEAIDHGFVTDTSGNRIPLTEENGINILGNTIEATMLTPNRQYYGNLHNMGHNLISFSHDPDSRHLEDFGVMGDVATAMRDPVFYRWHTFIDNILVKHKNSLPQYTEQQLSYDGVRVTDVEAKISVGKNVTPNLLLTYWQKSDIDLAAALDFSGTGEVYASFTHLQHAPFTYTIKASNSTGATKMGTCRIFICPKYDEGGVAIKFNDKRGLAIEMDKFTVTLNPGENIIKRKSDESSVTIPYERSFRSMDKRHIPTDPDKLAEFRFCGCGWPDHLLLPKGTAEGFTFELFVMISNFDDDRVVQTNTAPELCSDSHSFCGLKDKLYPDKRGMGYPFDRRFGAETLDDFVGLNPNMKIQDIQIKFSNKLVPKQ